MRHSLREAAFVEKLWSSGRPVVAAAAAADVGEGLASTAYLLCLRHLTGHCWATRPLLSIQNVGVCLVCTCATQ